MHGSEFRPEDTFKGKIIVLNLPVKEYNELGQFAQVLFKFIWQRAVERRLPPGINRQAAEQTIRPVFLWADESQFFVNSYDALFQSTARASRACTVYLTKTFRVTLRPLAARTPVLKLRRFLATCKRRCFTPTATRPQTNGRRIPLAASGRCNIMAASPKVAPAPGREAAAG